MSKHAAARKVQRTRPILFLPRKLTWEEWQWLGTSCHWPDPVLWPQFSWLPKEVKDYKLTYFMWLNLPHGARPKDPVTIFATVKGQFAQFDKEDPQTNYSVQIGQ